MPLLARPGSQTGPATPPPGSGSDRQPLTITYIDPDGEEWPWSSPTSRCRALSVNGVGGPPTAYTDAALAGGASLPQSYSPAKRSIVVGLHVYDDGSQAGLLDLLDRLTFALWTERAGVPAAGRIVIARPDGRAREIEVFCTSGIEQTDADESRDAYQRDTGYVLTFESGLDPLFSDTAPVSPLVFAVPPATGGVPPLLPVVLAPSTTLGANTITNTGNGDAYPIWTIRGPGTPTLTNVTTGREFSLGVALGADEEITVDTRPARQSAVDALGADRWGDLVKSSPRDLWTLVPGPNKLNLELSGSASGSEIRMVYHRRWLRA